LTCNWDVGLSSNEFTSNGFTIFERVDGAHSDIVYLFSSDELFKLTEQEQVKKKKSKKT